MKKRVLSGVQPSGNLHIGNYLGALKNWAEIQSEHESFFCIVDLHAITVYQEPSELRKKIEETAALFIACGIDPKQSAIFVQSSVHAHAELAWLLTCVTPVGWLQRMTQFKAKSEAQETISDGLLQYPVLMAADILLYDAAIVPVGEDQIQHLELTRNIVTRFHSLYRETFIMPEATLPSSGAKIMGLDDPERKMSKSIAGSRHAIGLLDSPDVVRKKIKGARMDSNPMVGDQSNMGPGVRNLLEIYAAFTGKGYFEVWLTFRGMLYGDLKKQVAEMVVSKLEPIQTRYREITADPGYLDAVLKDGMERASSIANATIARAKRAMGLYAK